MIARTVMIAVINAESRVHENRIDAAYWTYTRSRRGRPPVLIVPDAYARVRELRDVRRRILRS